MVSVCNGGIDVTFNIAVGDGDFDLWACKRDSSVWISFSFASKPSTSCVSVNADIFCVGVLNFVASITFSTSSRE